MASSDALLQVHRQRMSVDDVRSLIADGAAVNCRGKPTVYETTPLHEAMLMTSPRVAEVLIEAGADVNAVVKQGFDDADTRPIDVALHQPGANAEALVKTLLAAKADVTHLSKKDVPKKLQALFPKLPTNKKATLENTKNPHVDLSGVEGWAAGIDAYLDDVLYIDPSIKPSSYQPQALWEDYLLHDDVEPVLKNLSAVEREKAKELFLALATKLTKAS